MSPQRRTALVSVAAACVLIAIKLGVGLGSDSLGLLSEAIHSGTDLVAALLTFFAVGVAGRPADRSHPYGHGKAEHLAALAEAAFLAESRALRGRTGHTPPDRAPSRGGCGLVGLRRRGGRDRDRPHPCAVSLRAARRYGSPALAANALHFGATWRAPLLS